MHKKCRETEIYKQKVICCQSLHFFRKTLSCLLVYQSGLSEVACFDKLLSHVYEAGTESFIKCLMKEKWTI